MPYANEHACRLIDPKKLKMVGSGSRKHDGKTYRILYGLDDSGKSQEQAYRYPVKEWNPASAEAHCKDHDGILFEKASAESKMNDFSYYLINDKISNLILSEKSDKLIQIPYLYKGKKTHAIFGDFVIDEKEFNLIIQNFNDGNAVLKDEKGKPYLNINYNHPESNETDPEKIKSAGRIYGFVKNGDRLDALAWFTDRAREYIQKKELNHISAEFAREWDDENGKPFKWVGLGAALTPKPFLKQNQIAIAMNDECVVLCTQNKENETMIQLNEETVKKLKLTEGKEIEEILKLSETAEQVTVKLTEAEKTVKDQGEKIKTQDEEILKLKEQVEALSKKGLPDGMVAIKEDDYKFLKEGATEAIKLRTEQKQKDVAALVEEAIKNRIILPAQKDFALKLAEIDSESFQKFVSEGKPVVDTTEHGSGGHEDESKSTAVKLNEAIKAKQDEINKDRPADKKISFAEADRILRKEKPDLYQEYYSK